jgi:Do/DeqQ family serine protease
VGTGLVVAAGVLLMGGEAWRAVRAERRGSTTHSTAAVSAPMLADGRGSYAEVVKEVAPGVVTIRTRAHATASPTQFFESDGQQWRRFFRDGDPFEGRQGDGPFEKRGRQPRRLEAHQGSGVVVSEDGYILTNHHVIDGAEKIEVEFAGGKVLEAKVVGSDKPTDLALLKVNASGLHPLPLADSDTVQVGDVVLAVGNPMGLGETVTMGILSAKGRSIGGAVGDYQDFLQTDAPINHGNSGGALVNTKGELIGINAQILSNSDGNIGIGFAIPANMARHVMTDLQKQGYVRRAQLGVTVQPMTADLAASLNVKQAGGVIVSSVTANSAADRAGLKQGDVIASFNGQPVHDLNMLRNRVADTEPGSKATVMVLRDGTEKTVTVTLDSASRGEHARAEKPGTEEETALGASVMPLTPEMAARTGLPRDAHGLVVEEVSPEGRAAEAGLQPGDVITQINRHEVRSAQQLSASLKDSADKPALLLVNREGHDLFVTVRPAHS